MRKKIKSVPIAIAVAIAVAAAVFSGSVAWACCFGRQDQDHSEHDELVMVRLFISDSAAVVAVKGEFLPPLRYMEFHRYVARDGQDVIDTLIEHRLGTPAPVNPKSGKPFELYEKTDINLYVTDEEGNIIYGLYTKDGELLTNDYFRYSFRYDPLTPEQVNVGDTVYALRRQQRRRRTVVNDPSMLPFVVKDLSELEHRPLSVYDVLLIYLKEANERYSDASDSEYIIITAENGVIYDKIVKLMDIARLAGFPIISLARLRG